jgi:hypothetical protein
VSTPPLKSLGTTWPSLRKAFTRHGLGMPARNPEAVRQRAIDAARQRTGRPATPSLDPVFVALNHGELPIRARLGGELAERVRRAEDYAVLGAEVVVELHTESHAAKPSTRAWAITRRADRAHRRHVDREQRADRHPADLIDRPYQPEERGHGCRCPLTPSTPARPHSNTGHQCRRGAGTDGACVRPGGAGAERSGTANRWSGGRACRMLGGCKQASPVQLDVVVLHCQLTGP